MLIWIAHGIGQLRMKMQGFFMHAMLAQNMLLNLCVRMHLETFWESLGNHGKGWSPAAAMVLMFRGRLHTAMLEPSTVTQHPINAGEKPVSVHTSSNYWMSMQAPTLPDLFVKRPQLVSEMMKLVHKSCLPIWPNVASIVAGAIFRDSRQNQMLKVTLGAFQAMRLDPMTTSFGLKAHNLLFALGVLSSPTLR